MKLSEHFKLEEFERSATAQRLNVDNRVPEALIPNLQALCENVLEPLRQQFGEPVYISSGYRCYALNNYVKGALKSQHMKGEAADIYSKQGAKRLREWYLWMVDNLVFDQLIWETRPNGSKWIHVSYKRTGPNRQQVFTCRK
ncbi:MAG: peptidase M15 [Bacteroidaceae bacterium]|nr:peptidase M15 [Bacteroidaceae bacterium]